jgi:YggT family protein
MMAGSSPGSIATDPYVAQFTFFWIQMLTWSIIARALLSWFPIDQGSAIYQVLYRVTEPIIDPFRRVMPNMGMIDLSPLAAIITLIVMGQVVLNLAAES